MVTVLELINEMQEEKRKQNKSPCHVLYTDLQRAWQEILRCELNRLAKEGEIGIVETINQKGIYVKR